MSGWKNPLPIRQSAQGITHPQRHVSEVMGERHSRLLAKRGVTAHRGEVCEPPAHIPSPSLPTRGSPSSLQLAFFIPVFFIVPSILYCPICPPIRLEALLLPSLEISVATISGYKCGDGLTNASGSGTMLFTDEGGAIF